MEEVTEPSPSLSSSNSSTNATNEEEFVHNNATALLETILTMIHPPPSQPHIHECLKRAYIHYYCNRWVQSVWWGIRIIQTWVHSRMPIQNNFPSIGFELLPNIWRANITWECLAVIQNLWRENYFEWAFMNGPKSALWYSKYWCYIQKRSEESCNFPFHSLSRKNLGTRSHALLNAWGIEMGKIIYLRVVRSAHVILGSICKIVLSTLEFHCVTECSSIYHVNLRIIFQV